jgi:hypothetical protein
MQQYKKTLVTQILVSIQYVKFWKDGSKYDCVLCNLKILWQNIFQQF